MTTATVAPESLTVTILRAELAQKLGMLELLNQQAEAADIAGHSWEYRTICARCTGLETECIAISAAIKAVAA